MSGDRQGSPASLPHGDEHMRECRMCDDSFRGAICYWYFLTTGIIIDIEVTATFTATNFSYLSVMLAFILFVFINLLRMVALCIF